jgi:pimeloyl-ACP methyl ester carboxylesterase
MTARFIVAAITILTTLVVSPSQGQFSGPVHRTAGDTLRNTYRIHSATGPSIGLLVLLPGYGGDLDSFGPDGYTPSELPALLGEMGVTTVVAVPVDRTLYMDDVALDILDEIIAEVREDTATPDRVVIGGFSVGGTGAVRYAQRCAAGQCRGTAAAAGVFSVDAPLDFERWYRGELAILARGGPLGTSAEARMVLDSFHQSLGGSPDQEPDAYRLRSPLLASSPEGGNARRLMDVSLRAYTEPDIHWWIENRNLDYGMMNAVDAAALVNLLRIAGHTRAELITTTGEGYRPDGSRHPHSWSIVDEEELAGWIVSTLAEAGSSAGQESP